jgi:hypothetical protein
VLAGASLGTLIGGIFGGFVAALLAIPTAGALQVLVKEVWQATAPDEPRESPAPAVDPADKYGNTSQSASCQGPVDGIEEPKECFHDPQAGEMQNRSGRAGSGDKLCTPHRAG